MTADNPLHKQLEEQKFKHGISYVQQAANSIKKLNSNELAHLNQIISSENDDPWRFKPVEVKLPTGQTHNINIISNPISRAREIVGDAMQMAGNNQALEAATYLYSQLVLSHLFKDANRRTAVLATLWLLQSHQLKADAHELLRVPIGDLRNQNDLQSLSEKIKKLVTPF